MAIVYKGWQSTVERYVALKVLPPQLALDSVFVQRFLHEGEAAASLHHPNIVHVYDVGEADGVHYMAMQYLEGQDLGKLIAREGALPLARVVKIVKQVASALDYAHSHGYVHRDVKPSNILIGPDDRATLTDFGIVRAADGTRLTRTGTLMGTPEYMSPEQVRGQDVDWRTDLYSLGAICYEMLSGKTPFSGETPAILHAHVYETPPPLGHVNPSLLPQIEPIVTRALAKEKEKRYASATELADALEKVGNARAPAEGKPEDRPTVVAPEGARPVPLGPAKRRVSPAWLLTIPLACTGIYLLLQAISNGDGNPTPTPIRRTPSATVLSPSPTRPPPTWTPTPRPPCKAEVNTPGDHLHLRECPGRQCAELAAMQHGEPLEVVGYSPQCSDWLLVRRPNGQQGWVASVYVNVGCDLGQVPVVTCPTSNPGVFELRNHGCSLPGGDTGCVKGQVFDRNGRVIPNALVEIAIGGQDWNSPANPARTNGQGWYEWNLTPGQRITFLSLTVDGKKVPLSYSGSVAVTTKSGCCHYVDFWER